MLVVPSGPTIGLVSVVALLGALSSVVGLGWAGWVVGLACGGVLSAVVSRGLVQRGGLTLGPANRVTLARAVLVCGVAALVAYAARAGLHGTAPSSGVGLLVGLSSLVLLLDWVDGFVARRTGTVSGFGARFDLEVDAFLILVLSLHAAAELGWWIVAIGLSRYVLLVAQRVSPWLRRGLPPSRWRKAVAVYQGLALTAGAAHVLPASVVIGVIVAGMGGLALSFATEVWALWQLRPSPPVAQLHSEIGVVAGCPPS